MGNYCHQQLTYWLVVNFGLFAAHEFCDTYHVYFVFFDINCFNQGPELHQISLLALKRSGVFDVFYSFSARILFLSGVLDVVHSKDPRLWCCPPFFPLLKTFHIGSLILKSENPSYRLDTVAVTLIVLILPSKIDKSV